MKFAAKADEHVLEMDAKPPIGGGSAMNPKQLLLAGVCGCTGMDVAALLRKHKQPVESLSVDAEANLTSSYPAIFEKISLSYRVTGSVDAAKLVEAVQLSQTKYCGVTAMVSKAVPVEYLIFLNGTEIGRGEANFW